MACTSCDKKKDNRYDDQRNAIKAQLQERFSGTETITVALVKTKNGFLGWRNEDDESLTRLKVMEYLFLVRGLAINGIY